MIGRASMDGTNRTVVQDYNLGFPNALALDYATQRLYWGDAGLTQLESSFVDGSDRQVLYQNDELYPYSMVLFGKTLYISNWIGMRVVTVGTRGVNNMEVLYSDPEYNPRGIRVVNRNIQNEGKRVLKALVTVLLLPTHTVYHDTLYVKCAIEWRIQFPYPYKTKLFLVISIIDLNLRCEQMLMLECINS